MSDIFVKEEKTVKRGKTPPKAPQGAVEVPNEAILIPADYIAVKLSSVGKLNLPAVVHVRNYQFDDALELSTATADTMVGALLKVMSGMLWEKDVDVGMIHDQELLEILLHVYVNFWAKELVDVPYPYTEEELLQLPENERNDVRQGGRKLTVTIPISAIQTKTLSPEFKEPIVVRKGDNTVLFRLPRMGDLLRTKRWIENRYAGDQKRLEDLQAKLKMGRVPLTEKEAEYMEETRKRLSQDLIKITQAQTLLSFNGQEFSGIEDRIEFLASTKMDLRFWTVLEQVISKQGTFGVDSEVQVISPISQEPVKRRFQFRHLDFISSMELPRDSGFDVSFGDVLPNT